MELIHGKTHVNYESKHFKTGFAVIFKNGRMFRVILI